MRAKVRVTERVRVRVRMGVLRAKVRVSVRHICFAGEVDGFNNIAI